MKTATLTIQGMTCGHCVMTVRKSLSQLAGVHDVTVTLDPPKAVVIYDPARVPVERLTEATADEGYPSTVE